MLTGQLVLFQGINRFNNHPGLFGISYLILADRTGLEPATSAVTGRHSNQLNYRSFLASLFNPCQVTNDAF